MVIHFFQIITHFFFCILKVLFELISRTKKDKAIYAITAKEVEIDSNGDGKPDMTAKADTQMAVTFFRGNKGGRYSIQLIDNPDLRNSAIALFQKGVTTFKEK